MVNTGDTAWILISSALVMLMTPGLALFYDDDEFCHSRHRRSSLGTLRL
jgi:hypothetical protein